MHRSICNLDIPYVFVALEFRHSNLEMLLRVMQKLASYGRLSGSVFFVSWSDCALLTNYSISGCAWVATRSPKGKKKTSDGRKENEKTFFHSEMLKGWRKIYLIQIFIFVHILAWEICDVKCLLCYMVFHNSEYNNTCCLKMAGYAFTSSSRPKLRDALTKYPLQL